MSSPRIAAALATLLVATAPVAYAETAARSATAATVGESTIHRDQFRASKMIGSNVYDVQNRKIGHVTVSGSDLPELRERAHHAAAYLAGEIDD